MRAEWHRWAPERVARFVRDWNEGMATDALREKYGVRAPNDLSQSLRLRGYVLEHRRPRPALTFKDVPGHTALAWRKKPKKGPRRDGEP